MRTPPKPRPHVFHDSGQTTWNGKPLCEICGSHDLAPVHDVRVPDEAGEIDARRLGESDGGQ